MNQVFSGFGSLKFMVIASRLERSMHSQVSIGTTMKALLAYGGAAGALLGHRTSEDQQWN